jgi:hypothetical protein
MITSWQLRQPLKQLLVKQEKINIVLIKLLIMSVINVIQIIMQFYQLEFVLYAKTPLLDVQNVMMEMLLMQLLAHHVQMDSGELLHALLVILHVLLVPKLLANAKMDISIKTQLQLHAQLVMLEVPKPDVPSKTLVQDVFLDPENMNMVFVLLVIQHTNVSLVPLTRLVILVLLQVVHGVLMVENVSYVIQIVNQDV